MSGIENTSIDELEMTYRAYNTLHRAGVKTLGQIDNMTDSELMRLRGVGRETLHGLYGIRYAVAHYRNRFHQGGRP